MPVLENHGDDLTPLGGAPELVRGANDGRDARGEILGYARKDLGKAQGLLEIQQRGDGQTTAVWTGYFEDERFGTVSLTLLLGAPTPADFDKAEAVLGSILESVTVR